MKKTEEKAVTLVALVLTIIILLILATIGATAGISTIQSAKFTKYQNELKVMQNKINELNTKGDTSIGKPLTQQQKSILEQSEISSIIFKDKTDEQIEEIKNGFVYLDSDTILNELGLEGIDNEYLVNIEHRYTICSEGYQYDGKTYYMTEQLDNGLYNVEYNDKNSKNGNYEVNYTQENKVFKIDIVNIDYDGYVSKWDVKYKKEGSSNWKTAPGTTFYISDTGTFIINVSHGDINLGDKEITLENSVEITGINKEGSDPEAAMPTGADAGGSFDYDGAYYQAYVRYGDGTAINTENVGFRCMLY